LCKNKIVLEIACGTGYWTQIISETATKIIATDYLEEMLNFARNKRYQCPVEFRIENAYDLTFLDNIFEVGVANFWFSHIPKTRIVSFLNEMHRVLKQNAIVFFADNNYIKDVGGNLVVLKDDENTYKLRTLENGSSYKILKNYFSKKELLSIFRNYDPTFSESNILYGRHFWSMTYTLNKSS
jgi:ubiquinone/menaquinone biosynthesis C-methylase UbiE